VSTLWTPSGEHRPDDAPDGPAPGQAGDALTAEAEGLRPEEIAELQRARAELAAVPVVDIIANHAVGLWQLAVLHLMPDPGPDGTPTPPRLEQAALAIDAFGALVEGLGPRLGPHDEALREALSQLRLAYVELSGSGGPTG